jgi:hypothetical protein
MVQINLLPDVKREFLHAQQSKHTFVVGAILSASVFLLALGLLYAYVQLAQPRHLTNLQTDIDSGIAKTKEVPKAAEMVTVQGALNQLPGLQDKKQATSRLFALVTGFTPLDVSYAEIKLDTTANTISLRGDTTNYEQANVLANNLKSAELTYTQNDTDSKIKPFSQIVFTNLGRAEQADTNKSVSFQIDMQYDPALFMQSTSKLKLSVKADSKELLIPSAKPFSGGTN